MWVWTILYFTLTTSGWTPGIVNQFGLQNHSSDICMFFTNETDCIMAEPSYGSCVGVWAPSNYSTVNNGQ